MKTSTIELGPLALLLALGGAGGQSVSACGGTGGPTGTSGGASSPPPPLSVDSVSSGGSGCPEAGSVSAALDPDTGSVLLTYSKMTLAYPPVPGFQHFNCAAGLSVHGVAGWQFAAAEARVEGVAHLPPGAQGKASTSVFFAGAPGGSTVQSMLQGFYDGKYTFADTFSAEEWSPCGESALVNINVGLNLEVPTSSQESASINVKKVEIPIVRRRC